MPAWYVRDTNLFITVSAVFYLAWVLFGSYLMMLRYKLLIIIDKTLVIKWSAARKFNFRQVYTSNRLTNLHRYAKCYIWTNIFVSTEVRNVGFHVTLTLTQIFFGYFTGMGRVSWLPQFRRSTTNIYIYMIKQNYDKLWDTKQGLNSVYNSWNKPFYLFLRYKRSRIMRLLNTFRSTAILKEKKPTV